MFGRNPLFPPMMSDPFFQDPFAHMNQVMRDMDAMFGASLMGPSLMGPGLMGPSLMGPSLLGPSLLAPPMMQMPTALPPRQPRQATTIIEEVDENEEAREGVEPIVEEPDEEPAPRTHSRTHRTHQQPTQPANNQLSVFEAPFGGISVMTGNMGGGGTVFMSSSSFTSVGGANGVTYQSSSQTRMGPGGVMEAKKVVKDGRTGTQSVAVARGLGEQRRTMIRSRNQTGEEQRQDILQHIQPEQTQQFEQRWVQAAENSLPGWGGNGQAQISFGAGQQQQQQRLALPQAGSQFSQQQAGRYGSQQQQQQQQYAGQYGSSAQHGSGGQYSNAQYGGQYGGGQQFQYSSGGFY